MNELGRKKTVNININKSTIPENNMALNKRNTTHDIIKAAILNNNPLAKLKTNNNIIHPAIKNNTRYTNINSSLDNSTTSKMPYINANLNNHLLNINKNKNNNEISNNTNHSNSNILIIKRSKNNINNINEVNDSDNKKNITKLIENIKSKNSSKTNTVNLNNIKANKISSINLNSHVNAAANNDKVNSNIRQSKSLLNNIIINKPDIGKLLILKNNINNNNNSAINDAKNKSTNNLNNLSKNSYRINKNSNKLDVQSNIKDDNMLLLRENIKLKKGKTTTINIPDISINNMNKSAYNNDNKDLNNENKTGIQPRKKESRLHRGITTYENNVNIRINIYNQYFGDVKLSEENKKKGILKTYHNIEVNNTNTNNNSFYNKTSKEGLSGKDFNKDINYLISQEISQKLESLYPYKNNEKDNNNNSSDSNNTMGISNGNINNFSNANNINNVNHKSSDRLSNNYNKYFNNQSSGDVTTKYKSNILNNNADNNGKAANNFNNIDKNIINSKTNYLMNSNDTNMNRKNDNIDINNINPYKQNSSNYPYPITNIQDSNNNLNPYKAVSEHIDNPNNISSSRWKKISNLIKTIKKMKEYDTIKLDDNKDFDVTLKDYKNRLFPNSPLVNLKKRRKKTNATENNDVLNLNKMISDNTENFDYNNNNKDDVRKSVKSRFNKEIDNEYKEFALGVVDNNNNNISKRNRMSVDSFNIIEYNTNKNNSNNQEKIKNTNNHNKHNRNEEKYEIKTSLFTLLEEKISQTKPNLENPNRSDSINENEIKINKKINNLSINYNNNNNNNNSKYLSIDKEELDDDKLVEISIEKRKRELSKNKSFKSNKNNTKTFNKKKSRKSDSCESEYYDKFSIGNNNNNLNDGLNNSSSIENYEESEIDYEEIEMNKISFIERIQKYILDGEDEALSKIKRLFELFEKELKLSAFQLSYVDYFSSSLCDGKTFIYLSCREGKLDIVKFFIETLKLDVKINSVLSFKRNSKKETFTESNLSVACRWSHISVVKYLISLDEKTSKIARKEKHYDPLFSELEIKKCLNNTNNNEIKKMLKTYNKKNYATVKCFC